MTITKQCLGFAIFSVMMSLAIIGLISVAMVNTYLTNTRAVGLETQRLRAGHLLDSGVRFAALSLASPRASVSGSAIPSKRLVYTFADKDVVIEIQNEAGFIDLLTADPELIKSALLAHGGTLADIPALVDEIQSLGDQGRTVSYRNLRALLKGSSISISGLMSIATLHGGQRGVHPALASEQVLSLVPKLSKAERDRVIAKRRNDTPSLISNPVRSDYFTPIVSAYYRVSTLVELEGRQYSKVQVIKMINQAGQLYQVQATL